MYNAWTVNLASTHCLHDFYYIVRAKFSFFNFVVFVFFQNYCEQDTPTKSGRRSQRGGNQKPTGQRHEKASRGADPAGEMGETVMTKKIRGFSDSEIRRFIKSYRKFGKTRSR